MLYARISVLGVCLVLGIRGADDLFKYGACKLGECGG